MADDRILIDIIARLRQNKQQLEQSALTDVASTSGDGYNVKELNYHLRYITYTSHTRDWISMNNQWPGTTLNTVGHDYTFLTNNDDLDWRKMVGRQFVIVDRATRWSQVQIYTVNNDVTIHYVATEPRHHYFQFTASLDAVLGSEFAAYDEVTVKVPDIDGRHLEDASYPMDTPDTFTVTARADGHLLEIAGNDASLDNGFQYWEIEQADDTGGTGSVVYVYGPNNLPTVLEVDPGTGKYYRIRAMSILGDYSDWSSWSSEINYGPTPAQAAWVDHAYNTFEHAVTWEHDLPSSVDYFHIFRNTSASDSGATLVGAYNRNATSALIAYSTSLGDYFGIRAVGYSGTYAATVWSSEYDNAGSAPTLELHDIPGFAVIGLSASDTSHTDPALSGYKVERADDASGTGATTLDTLRPYAGFPYQVSQAVLSTKYYRLTPVSKSGTTGTPTAWTALTVTAAEGGFKDYFDTYGTDSTTDQVGLQWLQLASFELDEDWTYGQAPGNITDGGYYLSLGDGDGSDLAVSLDLSNDDRFTNDDFLLISLSSTGSTTVTVYLKTSLSPLSLYYYTWSVASGWNFLKVKRSDFLSSGSPSWANINYITIENGSYGQTIHVDDLRIVKADPDDAATFNDTGYVWNFEDLDGDDCNWHIYAGNRDKEPSKPYSLGNIDATQTYQIAYVDGLDIETGTIQVGVYKRSGYGGGPIFFVSGVGYNNWDMYAISYFYPNLVLYRVQNSTFTSIASAAQSFSEEEILWIAVDVRDFQRDQGRIKVYASLTEGNIIQAKNLLISHKDTSPLDAGGTAGVINYASNIRFVNFSAGSPSHALLADTARALDGPIVTGTTSRLWLRDNSGSLEKSTDGENFGPAVGGWGAYAGQYTAKSAADVGYTRAPDSSILQHVRGGTYAAGAVSFANAVKYAAQLGVRLPTLDELQANVAAGTGGGYDAEVCWTCTPVLGKPGYFYGNYGNATYQVSPPLELDSASDTAYTRFVANVDVPVTGGVADLWTMASDLTLSNGGWTWIASGFTTSGATGASGSAGSYSASSVVAYPGYVITDAGFYNVAISLYFHSNAWDGEVYQRITQYLLYVYNSSGTIQRYARRYGDNRHPVESRYSDGAWFTFSTTLYIPAGGKLCPRIIAETTEGTPILLAGNYSHIHIAKVD